MEFDVFNVEEKLHVGISVKDFKAIVNHADTLKVSISAIYSNPGRPLQLSYEDHGMRCEMTLTTTGESRSTSVTPAPSANANANRNELQTTVNSRNPSVQPSRAPTVDMPPPVQPASRSFTRDSASQRPSRPSPPPTRASVNEQSLFLDDDTNADDSKWDEPTFDGNEDEGELRWVRRMKFACVVSVLMITRILETQVSSRILSSDSEGRSYKDRMRQIPYRKNGPEGKTI